MKIAIITTHIWPAQGYGGVAASASRLVHAWLQSGILPIICASDASEGSSLLAAEVSARYPGASVRLYRAWRFKRWGFGWGAPWRIWQTCSEAGVVYVNGIGTWPCTLGAIFSVLLNKPFVVAVHGGLMPAHVEAIRQHKPYKWLYYRLLTFPTLRRANAVHVCSPREGEAVRAILPSVRTVTIANGISLPEGMEVPEGGPLRICYIGRISKEKGINAFAREWSNIRQDGEQLWVAGGGTGPYFDEFLRLAESCGEAVRYLSEIPPAEVGKIVARSHFLVLPSGLDGGGERENFGNAVAEALAVGRPVLVTRGLAWDHLEEQGIGMTFACSVESIRAAVDAARVMVGTERYTEACLAARSFAEQYLSIERTADELFRLCRRAAEAGPGVAVGEQNE